MASKLIIPIYVNRVGKMLKRAGFTEYYSTSYKVQIKRGTSYRFHVYFVEDSNNSTTYLLDSGAVVRISLREEGVFDESTGVLASADSSADPSNFNNPYVIDLTLNTAEIDAYLGVDGTADNDVASATVEFGISWTEDAWVTKQENTDRVQGLLINDVNKLDDLTPATLPTPETWLTARAVRFDSAQTLNSSQKAQARSNIGVPNHNYAGGRAPTADDDSADTSAVGIVFSAGSLWIDGSASPMEAYRCTDATPTAAVWILTTMDGAEVQTLIDAALVGYLPYGGATSALDMNGYAITGVYELYVMTNIYAGTVDAAGGYQSSGANPAVFPYGVNIQNSDATNIASLYADYIYGNTTSSPEFPYGLIVSVGNDILTDYMQGTGGGLVNFRGGVSTEVGYGYESNGGASYHPNGIDLQGQWIYEPALLTRYSAALSTAIDIDMEYGRVTAGGNLSLDWNTRALYAADGMTVALTWASPTELHTSLPFNAAGYNSGGNAAYLNYGADTASTYGYTTNGGMALFPAGADMSNQSVNQVYFLYADTVDASTGFVGSSGAAANMPNGAILNPTVVGSLVGASEGSINYVNDATAPTIGATVAGGGAAKCLVCYNGTNWIVTALL